MTTTVAAPVLRDPVRQIGRRRFDFDRELVVMGIVNRTRDSFFDAGATYDLDRAVQSALAAAAAGAGWVDVGAVPFSPDAAAVSEAEELELLLPFVSAVGAASDIAISVDTFRPEVARRCVAAGAAIVNDTSCLRDPDLAAAVAESTATLVVTHSLAEPRVHLIRPRYGDVVTEVRAQLELTVERAVALGVPEDRIVIDPGHDLNKTTRHSLEVTRRLDEIAAIGLPLLAAVSNKDFVGEATGLAKPDRGAASLAAMTACALRGARILRMHDVVAAVRAATMIEAILGFRDPVYERHNV